MGQFSTPVPALGKPNYDSGEQTVTFSARLILAHGLGVRPGLVQTSLRCKTANNGYAVDDEIIVCADAENSGNAGVRTIKDATDITVNQGLAIQVPQKNTNTGINITVGDWRMIVRAWKGNGT